MVMILTSEYEEMERRLAELEEAGAKVCEGFEEGIFIRSTIGDHEDDWGVKVLPYLVALGRLAPGARATQKLGEEQR